MASETMIKSKIKYFQREYPDGVPLSILKLELGLEVEEMQKSLLALEKQGDIFIENGEYVKLVEAPDEEETEEEVEDDEPSVVTPTEPAVEKAKTYDLSEREIKVLEAIKDITDETGHVPRYLMEGTLLYGELKLNTLSVYNLIMSLENKGIIKKVQIKGSEYYRI